MMIFFMFFVTLLAFILSICLN